MNGFQIGLSRKFANPVLPFVNILLFTFRKRLLKIDVPTSYVNLTHSLKIKSHLTYSVWSYLRPSYWWLYFAEGEGFEPPVPCGTMVFKTTAIDHSANPPKKIEIDYKYSCPKFRRPPITGGMPTLWPSYYNGVTKPYIASSYKASLISIWVYKSYHCKDLRSCTLKI